MTPGSGSEQWDVDWLHDMLVTSGYPNLDSIVQAVRTGWRMRAHCPHHSVFSDNYRSGDQCILELQATAAAERERGILDPRGPFPGPTFSPMQSLPRGGTTRDGRTRGTVDAGGNRTLIDLWEDSWLPAGFRASPPAEAASALVLTAEQEQLRQALAAKANR